MVPMSWVLLVGCTDGGLYCIAEGGVVMWTFATAGPIFSSPLLWEGKAFVGSHDGHIYCVDVSTGSKVWKVRLGATAVYASPALLLIGNAASDAAIVTCNTTGELSVLAADDGVVLATYTLPGEVFSSPVCIGERIIIGCRDDHVYCLDWRMYGNRI